MERKTMRDEMENITITFTNEELEAIALALECLHGQDLCFSPIVADVESAMDKLGIKYNSQIL